MFYIDGYNGKPNVKCTNNTNDIINDNFNFRPNYSTEPILNISNCSLCDCYNNCPVNHNKNNLYCYSIQKAARMSCCIP